MCKVFLFHCFGTTFTINSNCTAQLLDVLNSELIENLIQSFWYFTFAYYIFKDLYRQIEKLRSADILKGKTDTNIKTEIL